LEDLTKIEFNKTGESWVLVAHTCNPSYSGGKDQNSGWKPAGANSSTRTYVDKPFTKIWLVQWFKALSSAK
jgi:hypothetical protein